MFRLINNNNNNNLNAFNMGFIFVVEKINLVQKTNYQHSLGTQESVFITVIRFYKNSY